MNEAGKMKHRIHVLLFLRGETEPQDTLLEHLVTTKRQVNREGHNGPLRRHVRQVFGNAAVQRAGACDVRRRLGE